jgi:hypothetical protein
MKWYQRLMLMLVLGIGFSLVYFMMLDVALLLFPERIFLPNPTSIILYGVYIVASVLFICLPNKSE